MLLTCSTSPIIQHLPHISGVTYKERSSGNCHKAAQPANHVSTFVVLKAEHAGAFLTPVANVADAETLPQLKLQSPAWFLTTFQHRAVILAHFRARACPTFSIGLGCTTIMPPKKQGRHAPGATPLKKSTLSTDRPAQNRRLGHRFLFFLLCRRRFKLQECAHGLLPTDTVLFQRIPFQTSLAPSCFF